jgi:hypothetical protein
MTTSRLLSVAVAKTSVTHVVILVTMPLFWPVTGVANFRLSQVDDRHVPQYRIFRKVRHYRNHPPSTG